MAEVLAEYPAPIEGGNGILYVARVCGAEGNNGLWQGWIEFVPVDGEGGVLRSPRETTQPNRVDTEYWATGLTPVYLEGALRRALNPLQVRAPAPKPEPAYDGPAPDFIEAPALRSRESVLNPFSVYQKGEALLRGQLRALSAWHLLNIVEAYDLAPDRNDLDRLSQDALVELIAARVKRRSEIPGE